MHSCSIYVSIVDESFLLFISFSKSVDTKHTYDRSYLSETDRQYFVHTPKNKLLSYLEVD